MAGPVVVPGQPDQSLLLKAVRHTEKDLRMPPRKTGPKLADPNILHRGFGDRLLGRLQLGILPSRGQTMTEPHENQQPSSRWKVRWMVLQGALAGLVAGAGMVPVLQDQNATFLVDKPEGSPNTPLLQ